jgi:hypothetical protein
MKDILFNAMGKKKEITYPVIEQKLTGIRCEEKIPYRAKQKKKKTAISKIIRKHK